MLVTPLPSWQAPSNHCGHRARAVRHLLAILSCPTCMQGSKNLPQYWSSRPTGTVNKATAKPKDPNPEDIADHQAPRAASLRKQSPEICKTQHWSEGSKSETTACNLM
eukprot:4418140-Amphidinium_carterae.1